MHKIINILIAAIILLGVIIAIGEIKDILKEGSITKFLCNGLLFLIFGMIMNIVFDFII